MRHSSFIILRMLPAFFSLLLGVLATSVAAQSNGDSASQPDQLYKAGMQAYESGDTEKALKLWFNSYLAARKADAPDPRLGISFLQAVAADSITKYYDTASIIYWWGMSTETVEAYTKVLQDEVNRLQILLPSKQYNHLEKKLLNDDPTIAANIRVIWDKADPSPSTRTNERLIEHWQRIIYAQNNYPGSNPAYNTDDRGLIYIRYGIPDKIDIGRINFNTGLIRSDVIDIIASRNFNNQVSIDQQDAVARAVLSYINTNNINPGYEIWKYNRELTNRSNSASADNLLFIFADGGDTGGFERQETIADLLPSSAFSESSFRQATVDVPGMALEINSGLIMLYDILRQLSYIDEYFNLSLSNLESTLFSSRQILSGSAGKNFQYQQEFDLSRLEVIAGPQASSLPSINLNVTYYRFLDEADQPYHIAVLHSFPQKYLAVNQKGYNYRHVFRLHTAQETIAKEIDTPPVNFQTIEGNTPLPTHSQFRIPRQPDSLKMEFAAEYYIPRDSTDELILTAAGKRTPDPPKKLFSTDPTRLEAADLVVGYTTETEPRGYFPFRVAYQNKIPATRDLVFHFEVYHLQSEAAGITKFQLMYELRKEGNLVQKLFGDEQQQGRLTLNFETRATRFAENITVETSNLEPGSYSLNIQITQAGSGRNIERELTFEIVG